jgi:hypothetical protein
VVFLLNRDYRKYVLVTRNINQFYFKNYMSFVGGYTSVDMMVDGLKNVNLMEVINRTS